MKICETERQFILLEDGMAAPENSKLHDICFTIDMFSSYIANFPQFGLRIKTWGGYGFQSYFAFIYSNILFTPTYSGSRDLFVLNILNQLKTGDSKKIMSDLLRKTFGDDKSNVLLKIMNDEYFSAMEYLNLLDNNEKLKKQKDENTNLLQKNNILNLENQSLKIKLDQLKKILLSEDQN